MWSEVIEMSRIDTQPTEKRREIFIRFGIPKILVNSYEPQFMSEEFFKILMN